MDLQREAGLVAAAFSQNVLVSGARLLSEDAAVYGSPEQRFLHELDAVNQVMSEAAGLPGMAPLTAQQFAASKMIALGKALAAAPQIDAEVLSRGVAVLGAISRIPAAHAADWRAGRAGAEAVAASLVNPIGLRHEPTDAA
jgi:hypothetical protein